MRSNPASLALTISMGLIVLLIGFGALSVAGLVNVSGEEAVAEQTPSLPPLPPPSADSSKLPAQVADRKPNDSRKVDVAAIVAGDALFKNNCAQCHAVHDKVVGPALAGITRRRTVAWLVPWVRNSSKVVVSGDAYAVKLFEEYGKQQMPSFPQLSKADVEHILAWVQHEEANPPVPSGPTVAYAPATAPE